jgi:phage shock protein C
MNMLGRTFEVDRESGKVLGVCAGIARHTGIDATIVRVGVVLLAIAGSFTWTAIAYFALALVGHRRRLMNRGEARVSTSREEARERMRSLDLRMQAIETYATSTNSRLAREIEDLR